MKYRYSFLELSEADIISGVVYESGGGGFAYEPLHKLFKVASNLRSVGTQSGIRRSMFEGVGINSEAYIVLVNNRNVEEWKNEYDENTKILTYYGDNRKSNNDMYDTKQKGNIAFKKIFNLAYGDLNDRRKLPPVFYFERTGNSSDMKFIGLAIPWVQGLSEIEALRKVKFIKEDSTFENYVAKFTIVPNLIISREWIKDLKENRSYYSHFTPKMWLDFVSTGVINVTSEITIENEIDESEVHFKHVSEILIESRLTQNKFRKKLLDKQKSCQICGIDMAELLIASHIKPWKISEDDEKIDVNNGLLLCANHDKLFDRYLISFDEDGEILISNQIRREYYGILNLLNSNSIEINEKQEKYLFHHRSRMRKE